MSASNTTFVGAWVRFPHGVRPNDLAYILEPSRGLLAAGNAVYLPSGVLCSVTVPYDLDESNGGMIVPEEEISDEMWAALAKWRLTQ